MQKLFLIILAVLLAATALVAIPYGVLGNINMPDAYVLPSKMMEVSLTNYFILSGSVLAAQDSILSADPYHYGFSASIGLFDKMEVGIVATGDKLVYGNAKLRLYTETEKFPSIAVGLENIFSKVKNTDEPYISGYDFTDPRDYIQNSPYIVGSKSTLLLTDIPYFEHLETTIHLGIGSRRFTGERSKVKQLHGFFGGLDLKPNKYVSFNGEVDSQNLNLGFNVYYKNFTIRACVYRLEDYFKKKGDENFGQKFALGIKYTIDKYSEVKAADKNRSFKFNTAPKVKKTPHRKILTNDTNNQSIDASNPLLQELERIRKRREQAEKELQEIKKLLEQ